MLHGGTERNTMRGMFSTFYNTNRTVLPTTIQKQEGDRPEDGHEVSSEKVRLS